jgi:CBS domain-containing protein
MNENPTHISSDAMAVEALDLMKNRDSPFMVLPVLEQNSKVVVGIIHLHDLVAQGL